METVRTVAELRTRVTAWQALGETCAVIPTMGGLHAGHISLIHFARERTARSVATLFVNPTQFGANEDLDAYPRDETRDADMLRDAGCDLLFAPSVDEMYPPGFSTRVIVDGLTDALCGAVRPGHFDGVAQVVTKLLNQARCDVAVFGEKDWQQIAVVRRLARDLDIPTEILGAPTIREADGLAMSSRNHYLTAPERTLAPLLAKTIMETAKAIAAGSNIADSCTAAKNQLVALGFGKVEYVEARTADHLDPLKHFDPAQPSRIFAAAYLGRARLIDNMGIS